MGQASNASAKAPAWSSSEGASSYATSAPPSYAADPFDDAATAAYDGGAELAYDDAPSDDQADAFAGADAFDA